MPEGSLRNEMQGHIPRSRRRTEWAPYAFVLPYLLLLLAFGVFPILYALGLSFFETGGQANHFAGLANYRKVLGDYRLGQSVLNVMSYIGLWLPAMALGVTGLALLLHARPGRLSSALRLVYYLPGAVSGTAAVLLWLFMLEPQISPFGPLLRVLGFTQGYDVLAARNLPVVFAVMAFFASAGGWIVVLYGALTSIPGEVLEAARIDGCTDMQLATRIKLPMVSKNAVFMLVLSFAAGFQLFVEPALVNKTTLGAVASGDWAINQIAYSYAFTRLDFGGSSALSTLLLLVGLIVALWLVFRTDFYRVDT